MAEAKSKKGAEPPIGEADEQAEDEHEDEHDELDEAARHAADEDADEGELTEAHNAYLLAVMDHFGPEAPVHPCPTCETRGYLVVKLRADPNARACDDCGGLGVTATGSLVEGNATRPCPTCHGAGFRETFEAPVVETPFGPGQPPEALPPEAFPVPVVTPLAVGEAS